ncbi:MULTISPECIES: RNA polymerase sigma factor SigF [unclassified Nocardia]|uniref:RNA polymerase sigma factor SigF n=1 Tax=unclassified Nocardia TaxID=2637762 RepID=UPI001CE48112|nr:MULTISPECIES: RNA polymerase sigma factor SigF [unclassified Nocardia]
MTDEPTASVASRAARGTDSYDNIEPMFEKLAGFDSADPQRAAVRAQLIGRCLPLAEHIARRFAGRGELFDDLLQVARLGLVHAVDRFDVERGSSFLSYAVPTIMGEVRRHFRDSTWGVRVPRRTKEIQLRIGPTVEALAQRIGRLPKAREIAAELDVEIEEVTQALIAGNAYQLDSIDSVAGGDIDNAPLPVLEVLGSPEHGYELVDQFDAVRPLLAELPDRERRVLVMRFFESRTQSQIAEELGISQMHVSRILSRTLTWLREEALRD